MHLSAQSVLLSAAALSSAQTSDFIIIGGGTAGLTIAARLSEDAQTTVTVLEAGEDRSNDINVLAPGLFTSLYVNPDYDWNYHTVPQEFANGHVLAQPRGKQLGGSSAINFLWWTHASQQDLNNWGRLGNHNWSWDAVEPFYRRAETYIQPTADVVEALKTEYIEPGLHGNKGPVLNTFADIFGPFDEAWPRVYDTLGLPVNADPRDGLALGGYTNLINMDPKTRSRSYAATTYLQQARNRPNFRVVTDAHVNKVLFDSSQQRPRATGALYTSNGTSYIIHASKEIILSAGVFGSPQLLELSGIGNATTLNAFDIPVLVNNENVGENLQDHAYVPLAYSVREPGIFTLDDFANETLFNEAYQEYTTNRTGLLATTSASSGLLSLEQIAGASTGVIDLNGTIDKYCSVSSPSEQVDQHSILCTDIRAEAVVQELSIGGGMSPQLSNDSSKLFLSSTGGNSFTLLGVLEHPFSCGSVHIQSSNASDYPRIDPNYLSHPLDITILSAIALHLQVLAKTKPLSDLLVGNGTVFQPGYYHLNATSVEGWIRDNLQSEYHPCGTCAMLPESSGGVVDDRYRVYGVDGLRVVDASVFPLIPRANLQTLVYALAERASNFIREDLSLGCGSDGW